MRARRKGRAGAPEPARDAGLGATVATQLRHIGLALARARERARALALIGTATAPFGFSVGSARSDGTVASASRSGTSLPSSLRTAGVLPRRRAGLPLRAAWILRAGGGGRRRASGRRRSATGKANALSPLIAVVKTICHLNRLASCITRLSYKKDVQQMRARAKSSVNGTNGGEFGAIKRHPPRAKRKGLFGPLSKDVICGAPADYKTSISTVTNETVITVSRTMYLAAVLM